MRLIPGFGFVIVQGDGKVKILPRGGFFIDPSVNGANGATSSTGSTGRRRRGR